MEIHRKKTTELDREILVIKDFVSSFFLSGAAACVFAGLTALALIMSAIFG
jgi:hypothetical protein